MADEIEFEEEEFSTQFNGQTLVRIMAQTRPHWKWVVGFLVTVTLVAASDAYFTYLRKQIIDLGITPGDTAALVRIGVIYGVMIIFQAAGVFTFIYLAGVLGERVRYDLRKKTFDHLQDLALTYYSKTPVGWIMSRVTSDTVRIAELVTWGMLDVTASVVSIVTAFAFMLFINFQLALLVLLIIPVLIFVAAYFKQKIIVEYRKVRKINSKITGAYNENITGVRVVKALGREEENLREFGELTGEMYDAGFRAAWLSALFLPAVQVISAIAIGIIIFYGGSQVEIGGLTEIGRAHV
jgi:ATP-binding cassette subfamily B protein